MMPDALLYKDRTGTMKTREGFRRVFLHSNLNEIKVAVFQTGI